LNLLRNIPDHRARNVLRYFLRSNGVAMPDSARLEESLRQALTARSDARVCVNIGDVELRRFRDFLHIVRPLPEVRPGFEVICRSRAALPLPQLGGKLVWERRTGDGLSMAHLRHTALILRMRTGGEGLRLRHGGPTRTVRNLLQEAGVPPWQREYLPMLYLNGVLAGVPGLGVDVRFCPAKGDAGWFPLWMPE
jgi:tRNA(Ile)-lysidine synthase